MTDIFAPWNSGFGDQWAAINLLAHRSIASRQPVMLHSPPSLREMHTEILNEIVVPYPARVRLVDDASTESLSGYDVWATPFLPTQHQWGKQATHPKVCYQFDGLSSAADKNPSAHDEALLLRALRGSGFEPVRLGKHLSVDLCIEAAFTSAFFVGVDSGMAHLCHSVGVPMFLLEYKLPIVTCHRGKAYIHCQGTEDFLRHKLPTWIDYLRFIGHVDGSRSTVPVGRKHREQMEKDGIRWWLPNAGAPS